MKTTWITAIAQLFVVLLGSRLAQAQPATPDLLTPCALARDEISAALDLDVEKTQVADMKFAGGRDVGCLYTVKGSATVLTVRQTWDKDKSAPSAKAGEARFHAIPGDADRAASNTGPPDHPSAELVYWRGKVKTRLLVHGPTLDPNAMLSKLLKLRRVP